MKYIITILLFVTIAVQTFSKWAVVLAYEINRDYIAHNLCEKRTKVSNCCKGKCFLRKKLVADENQQQPGKTVRQEDSQVDLFFGQFIKINFQLPVISNRYNSYYLNDKSQEFTQPLFQPPRC